jgi:hypothetical protein
MSLPCRSSLIFLALLVSISAAHADSISVTGSGVLGGDIDRLQVSAGSFSAYSAAPAGPSFVLGASPVGVQVTLEWGVVPFSGPGFTTVNLGNQFTDILTGGITFTSTFTIPASALVSGTFTAPISVMGGLGAYQDLLLGQGQGSYETGPLMGTLQFVGTGMATFEISDVGQGLYHITSADATFTGQGMLTSVTPEPSSFLLMGSGIAGLWGVWRRKRSVAL